MCVFLLCTMCYVVQNDSAKIFNKVSYNQHHPKVLIRTKYLVILISSYRFPFNLITICHSYCNKILTDIENRKVVI